MECFICKGNLTDKQVKYMVDLEKTVIIIKNVPAKVCEHCNEQYFEDEIVQNIEKIVAKLHENKEEVTIVNYEEEIA